MSTAHEEKALAVSSEDSFTLLHIALCIAALATTTIAILLALHPHFLLLSIITLGGNTLVMTLVSKRQVLQAAAYSALPIGMVITMLAAR